VLNNSDNNKKAQLSQRKTRYSIYRVPVAVLTSKVIQGRWFSFYLEWRMRFPISGQ